jgi:hypothetical protein
MVVIVSVHRPDIDYAGSPIIGGPEPTSPSGKHCGSGEQENDQPDERFALHVLPILISNETHFFAGVYSLSSMFNRAFICMLSVAKRSRNPLG